jgi:hypothetical protein
VSNIHSDDRLRSPQRSRLIGPVSLYCVELQVHKYAPLILDVIKQAILHIDGVELSVIASFTIASRTVIIMHSMYTIRTEITRFTRFIGEKWCVVRQSVP